jgi:tRNA modification GTPase
LRLTAGEVEREGIRRARALAVAADLKLVVVDAGELAGPSQDVADLVDASALVVANKWDLTEVPADATVGGHPVLPISCRTGAGLDSLLRAIEGRFLTLWPAAGGGPGPTRARHRSGVVASLAALERARDAELPELEGEDLRLASRALGRITGRVDVEDLLDVVFRDFCVGK